MRSYLLGSAALLLALCACNKEQPRESGKGQASKSPVASATLGPESSAIRVDLSKGWCGSHGVPESVCTRCNSALVAQFKAAGDWCAEHGLPESQCTLCHPEVKAKWEALGEKSDSTTQPATRPGGGGALRPLNDPLCPVEQTAVRFRDKTVAERAGIQTEPVTRRRMTATLEAPAEVDFDRTRVTQITPRAAGVVRTIAVNLGDSVKPGDVLAVIESPELGEAKSRFIELSGNCVLAQADLERVRTIYQGTQTMLKVVRVDSTTEEARAALADVTVGEAKSTLLKAHAGLELARASLQREQRLLSSKAGTEQAVEAARAAVAISDAEFHAAREAIAFAAERDRLAAERAVRVARAALDAAERKLHILGLSEEEVAQFGRGVDTALSHYELRSPVAGRVIQRRVSVGEAVDEKAELLTIADLSTMWLLIDVNERELPVLRVGQPVLFMADGVEGLSASGKVTWIDAQVNDRTRTLRARAELPNEQGLLKALLFGRARIGLRENEPVLTVPAAAVQTDGCCQLVFVRESDEVFMPRKVVLGTKANGHVEVIRGLSEGEPVATAGSFLLKTEILKGNIGAGCCEVKPGR